MRWIAVGLLLVLTGCSSIPAGGDPATDPRLRVFPAGAEPLGTIVVAPVSSIAMTQAELEKGWRLTASSVIDARAIGKDVARALSATRQYGSARASKGDAFDEAWRNRESFVVEIGVRELETTYEGRNGYWIPNILLWSWFVFPAWWVATEEYSLTLEAQVRVRSAESGGVLAERTIAIRSAGSFDEFDRGWHLFGAIYTPLDPERWQRIADRLFPEAQRLLAVEVALESTCMLRELTASSEYRKRTQKTLALIVGVSHHADNAALPPLPYASSDARSVAKSLSYLPSAHVETILDDEATRKNVLKRLEAFLSRAGAGDTVLIYFAGYGVRTKTGAALALHDGRLSGEGCLSLATLAKLLKGVQGSKLLVLDTSFGGGRRAASTAQPAAGTDELAVFASNQSLGVLVAGGRGQQVLSPDHLRHGLLTYHLVRGLRGKADRNQDGRISGVELADLVRPAVSAEAALLGSAQQPRGLNLGQFSLRRASQ